MAPNLGLTNIVTTTSVPEEFSPEQVENLVGWWDFTDTDTMYTDAGSTKVSSNDDKIYRIDNKAYTLQGNDNAALGTFLQQGTESRRPLYKTAGIGGALFDGSNDFLRATRVSGNVTTNVLSTTTLNGRAITAFYVVELPGTTVSGDEYLFNINGDDNSDSTNTRWSIYVNNADGELHDFTSDTWRSHHQDDDTRAHHRINSEVLLTTNKELWTVDLDGDSSGSLYRNGDTTAGVTDGSTGNLDLDFSANDNNSIYAEIGGRNGSNFINTLVYEIIVYDSKLEDADIASVEAYLTSKHSIS